MIETVRLESDHLTVEIAPLGARLQAISFDGSPNLVDSAATREEALGKKKYHGASVGPVANRIAGASANIDGRICTFDANEGGITTLHSGLTGVHAVTWDVAAKDASFVMLRTTLPDGTGGFPGTRELTATFKLIGADMLVAYEAETDRPTWINLALHPYWSLGTDAAGLRIFVNADRFTPVDDAKIPTGEIAPVDGTPFDLRALAQPSNRIDHNFALNGDAPAVTLASDRVRMDVSTDAPGVQIFTGKPFGFAIEPQHFPDAMHHDTFASIELRPGECYRQDSRYRFSRA